MDQQCRGQFLVHSWSNQLKVKARYWYRKHYASSYKYMNADHVCFASSCLQAELDRFCDALISIREEISLIEKGKADMHNNVLKVRELGSCRTRERVDIYTHISLFSPFMWFQGAPHPPSVLMADAWTKPYSREYAAYPAAWLKTAKFWPTTGELTKSLYYSTTIRFAISVFLQNFTN